MNLDEYAEQYHKRSPPIDDDDLDYTFPPDRRVAALVVLWILIAIGAFAVLKFLVSL